MNDKILDGVMDDIATLHASNPQAAGFALGMELMARSRVETDAITNDLLSIKDRRIEELEQLADSLYDDAMNWRKLRFMLRIPVE